MFRRQTLLPPSDQFSCGRINVPPSSKSSVQRRSLTQKLEANRTFDGTWLDDYSDNVTQLFDDYNYMGANDSEPLDTSPIDVRSGRTSSAGPDQDNSNLTESEIPYWAFPTLPSIKEKENTDQRIVGGDEAIPGEIPWQVQLHPAGPTRRFKVSKG